MLRRCVADTRYRFQRGNPLIHGARQSRRLSHAIEDGPTDSQVRVGGEWDAAGGIESSCRAEQPLTSRSDEITELNPVTDRTEDVRGNGFDVGELRMKPFQYFRRVSDFHALVFG